MPVESPYLVPFKKILTNEMRKILLGISGFFLAHGYLPAQVQVIEAGSDIEAGIMQVRIGGPIGKTYAFQGSPDLQSWVPLQTVAGSMTATTNSSPTAVSLSFPGSDASQYFVRGTSNFALRFFGSGLSAPDLDRVKIRVDDPLSSNDIGPPVDIGSEDFTLEFWMRAVDGENTAGGIVSGSNDNWINGNIIIDRDRYSNTRDYGISLGDGRIAFGVSSSSGTWTITGATPVDDGQWHHIAVQRRRSDGYLWLYVDGLIDAQVDGPDGDISYPDDGEPGPYCGGEACVNSDPFLVIGAEKHDAGIAYPSYSGWIDELRISNTLRYSANFVRPSRVFTPDISTVALYHFDDGTGDVVTDSASFAGGPSHGERRFGGASANSQGPLWVISTAPLLPSDTPLDQIAPTAPQNLSATFVDFDEVLLTWDASTDNGGGIVSYRIFRDSALIGTSSALTYTDNGPLTPETEYTYTVLAYDPSGNASPISNFISINTPVVSTQVTVDFDNPAPPTPMSLDGVFQGIDFGSGQWNWEFGFSPSTTNSIYFSSNQNSRTFTFVGGPRLLESLVVYTAAAATLTIDNNLGNSFQTALTSGSLIPITTGWSQASSTITISFTGGWDLGIDELVYSTP